MKILDQIDTSAFEMQDIKEKNISEEELDYIANRAGGYEPIFSKRAMKYRSKGLNNMSLNEEDYKKYMLEEYTFLKRPFVVDGEKIYIGNSKKVVSQLVEDLG